MSNSLKHETSLGITWEKLHKEICCNSNLCKQPMELGKFMSKMFSRIPNDKETNTPIKASLFKAAFAPKGDIESPATKKYIGWMYHANDGIHSRFNNVRDYLITQKNEAGEDWDYRTHPEVIAFKKIWEELIPASGSECKDNDNVEDTINEIILSIPSNPLQVMERLDALNTAHEYSLTLAIMSIIASTLFCFGYKDYTFEENDYALQDLFLPPLPKREESHELQRARQFVDARTGDLNKLLQILSLPLKNPLEKGEAYYLLAKQAYISKEEKRFSSYLDNAVKFGNKKAIRLKNEGIAIELLSKARSIYGSPQQNSRLSIKECCEICQKVLHISPSVNKVYRGEASYILYKYMKVGRYTSPTGESAQDFLDESHRCGYELANDDWMVSNTFSITPPFKHSSDSSQGICYVNTDNIYAKTFSKTIPETWNTELKPFNIQVIEKDIYNNNHCRFLFIDDNPQKNCRDFFSLLQLIKESAPEALENYEIFLRHKFDFAKSLVDTALNHLINYQIPVYILDDDKQAAQQLLSFHPLFYPIKAVNFNSPLILSGQEKPILNFIILGNTNVAEWLVRESFWMMGFKDNLIENKIIVLADNGTQFVTRIKSQYPGMAKGNLEIDGIEFPEICGIDIDFSAPTLSIKLTEILKTSPYNYFVVSTDTDEENLSLAMRIRELLIKNSILERNNQELDISSPVAFLCRDDNLSWISKKMVVEKEEQGEKWFNTWALIPFGEISKRYSWDNITGGTFEKLARCIHYQYSRVSPEDAKNRGTKNDNYVNAKKEYYLRQYNQDSSYSSALSMPYRIFQFQDSDSNQITPTVWHILQTSAFSTVSHLKELANRFDHFRSHSKEEQAISEWEHARWVKWMLSRGWLPSTTEDAIFAYNNGNPRQQLFVAKLHPCICSYSDLKILQNALLNNCNIKRDFFSADLLNIRNTQKLLSLEWIDTPSRER